MVSEPPHPLCKIFLPVAELLPPRQALESQVWSLRGRAFRGRHCERCGKTSVCLKHKLFQAITFITQIAVLGESHTVLLAEMPMCTQRFVELRYLFR